MSKVDSHFAIFGVLNWIYGQKEGHESNSHFDYWPLEPRNMDQMTFDLGVQHDIGKILSKITTL
jgi:hypothetical protein